MKAYRNDIQNLTVLCFNFSFPENKIFCFDAMSGTKVELMIIQKQDRKSIDAVEGQMHWCYQIAKSFMKVTSGK